jgi:hypothetical protein
LPQRTNLLLLRIAEYFHLLGIAMLRGRLFTEWDIEVVVYPIRGTTDFLFYQILAIMER